MIFKILYKYLKRVNYLFNYLLKILKANPYILLKSYF